MIFKTEQEIFWAGEFGTAYIDRNEIKPNLSHSLARWSKHLRSMSPLPQNALEFGCNIGINLHALKELLPGIALTAIEINAKAADIVNSWGGVDHVYNQSILEFIPTKCYDLVFIFGVLIHQSPEFLPQIYDKLYTASGRYILLCEYYNPTPVEIPYRGHSGKLFKRDFAGELLDRYENLRLVDYGFHYHRDPLTKDDDPTWFLLQKNV